MTTIPDPSQIGVIPEPPLAILPDPAAVFARRAERLTFLAGTSRLKPYLEFLATIVGVQAALVRALPPIEPLPAEQVARAREARMPPIDRAALAGSPGLLDTLERLLADTAALPMPDLARAAHEALSGADAETRRWLLDTVLADDLAGEDAAPGLFAAAAVQVETARLAATLDAGRLVPIRTGVCPACGGRPASSIVRRDKRLDGARYAACATCQTLWNEVRIKCLACGSTKGIGYRALSNEAAVKAEVCGECNSWVKILYATTDAALEPIADDVASLGLDALMRDTPWKRAGVDPFLVGP